jgi:hypothetical protein
VICPPARPWTSPRKGTARREGGRSTDDEPARPRPSCCCLVLGLFLEQACASPAASLPPAPPTPHCSQHKPEEQLKPKHQLAAYNTPTYHSKLPNYFHFYSTKQECAVKLSAARAGNPPGPDAVTTSSQHSAVFPRATDALGGRMESVHNRQSEPPGGVEEEIGPVYFFSSLIVCW